MVKRELEKIINLRLGDGATITSPTQILTGQEAV
jgi:hypothetical protein